ncbi:hypothetical protein niasHS_006551 [Heterodera schachtii]|uniref:Uncharacterized protein n=1 Tax=Heterodera schachtii TaxID=97005 RepID=A0ABD2JHW1_HETSC
MPEQIMPKNFPEQLGEQKQQNENGEPSGEEQKLNYQNTRTNVHPLIVQLCRCELDEEEEKGGKGKATEAKREKSPPEPIFRAEEHNVQFDPDQYLDGFYKSAREDTAMQIVLFFLPGMICRLPNNIETMLDLGAGPTVYIPLCARNHVASFFSSDYAQANRKRLIDWVEGRNRFDWTEICKWIANIEANNESAAQIQEKTRKKMRAVLEVTIDYRADERVEVPEQFELVATVFCMEYSCEDLDGYRRAISGACGLIKPGGWLLQGGIFHATEYSFGGKRFSSHFLRREDVFMALKENGMCSQKGATHDEFHFITHEDIFLLLAKKVGTSAAEGKQ